MQTVGLVIWKNHTDRTAIVWCDDLGPLVHIENVATLIEAGQRLRVGDLIQLACREEAAQRRICVWLRILMPAFLPEAGRLFDPASLTGTAAVDSGRLAWSANRNGPPLSTVGTDLVQTL